MNVPKVDIKQLLEAGVHLGHKTLRWNPKMKQYIFGEKNSIHIIDLFGFLSGKINNFTSTCNIEKILPSKRKGFYRGEFF